MRDLLCRAVVVAGAVVVLLGLAAGAASASAAPGLSWSRGGHAITSRGVGHAVGGRAASRAFARTKSGGPRVTAASASRAGSVTYYPGTISPEGIAAGPDGALWFTNNGSNNNAIGIGRITTTGQITNYT